MNYIGDTPELIDCAKGAIFNYRKLNVKLNIILRLKNGTLDFSFIRIKFKICFFMLFMIIKMNDFKNVDCK